MCLDPSTLESYRKWFRKVLLAPGNCLLIIEAYHPSQHWIPIGQVRFNECGEIGVSLSQAFRGQHLATPAIEAGICYLKQHSSLQSVFAYIKQDNDASARAFERAGFGFVCETAVQGHACRVYAYHIRDVTRVRPTSVSTHGSDPDKYFNHLQQTL